MKEKINKGKKSQQTPETEVTIVAETQPTPFIKRGFIKLDQSVKALRAIGNILIIWTQDTIIGYEEKTNKILWKIKTEKWYMGSFCDERIMCFNDKAVFVTRIKSTADLVFCVEPETGKLLWTFTEGVTTDYKLMPSRTKSQLLPVINNRKVDLVNKTFLVFIDLQTGKKQSEIVFPEQFAHIKGGALIDELLFIYGAKLEKKLDKSVYNDKSLKYMTLQAMPQGIENISEGEISTFFYKGNYIYFVLEYAHWTDAQKIATEYSINRWDLLTKEHISIPWPDRSKPSVNCKIQDDFSEDETKVFITWGTRNWEKGEYKGGIFDFNKKKFAWTDTFVTSFMTTHEGVYLKEEGLFTRFKDGVEIPVPMDFKHYYGSLFYANRSFFYNIGEGLDIYQQTTDGDQEVKKASADSLKTYIFNEEVKNLK